MLPRPLAQLPHIELTLTIGAHAVAWHLGPQAGRTLTDIVRAYHAHGAQLLALPHPSPQNNGWLQRNPWFEAEVLPLLRERVRALCG